MHIEKRCKTTQILLSEQINLKLPKKPIHNTAPSTKQSEDCIYTNRNPLKKGYCSFFSFFLSLKRATKYIKTYLQCVVFGQRTQNNKKNKALW